MTVQDVLVVDDEAPMRKLLSNNLKASGYAVRLAADGAEALKLIEEHTDRSAEPGADGERRHLQAPGDCPGS